MTGVRRAALVLLAAALLASCGTSSGTPGTSGPPSPGASLAPVELKLELIDHVGKDFVYCDPDSYPVAHGTELQNARMQRRTMAADPSYPAILDHLGLAPGSTLSDEQLIAAYRLYKKLRFVELRPRPGAEPQRYDFTIRLQDKTLTGTISDDGEISGERSAASGFGCPICLARNTHISTPGGFVRVQDVRVGMTVWSTDRRGRRIRATVVAVGRTPVPPTHEVVRLILADGRTVLVSPGHPTPDGTPVGELRTGTAFDGSTVVSTRRIPYSGGFTYDLLPSGPTGTYFANGVLLGSTLSRHPSRPTLRT
jgi:hypothetical protein